MNEKEFNALLHKLGACAAAVRWAGGKDLHAALDLGEVEPA